MTAVRTILGVSLAATLALACAQLGVAPSARFKIDERFLPRFGEAKVLGIEVVSGLPNGSVSEADLKKLSAFVTDDLWAGNEAGQGSFDAIINITGGARAEKADLILTVAITLLEAATPEERKNRVPSHLHAIISLQSRESGKKLGTASIWATGSGLDLEPNYQPQTVRAFTNAIRDVLQ
jgi:hypothetical protein